MPTLLTILAVAVLTLVFILAVLLAMSSLTNVKLGWRNTSEPSEQTSASTPTSIYSAFPEHITSELAGQKSLLEGMRDGRLFYRDGSQRRDH
jgi:hypothetical protein